MTAKPTLLKIWRTEITDAPPATPGEILAADANGLVVACGKGALRILELQREGGKRLAAADFLAGHKLARGQRLG